MSFTRNVACRTTPVPSSATSVLAPAMLHDGFSRPPHRHVVKTPRPTAPRHAGDAERPGATSELDRDVADARGARDAVGDRLADEDRHGRAAGLGEEPDGAHHGVVDVDRRRARHPVVTEEERQLTGEGLARAGRAARPGGRLRPRRPVLDARLGLGAYGHRRRRLRPRARPHPDLRGRWLGRTGEQRDPEGEATRAPRRPPGPHGRGSVPPGPGACQGSKSAWPPPMSLYASPTRKSEPVTRIASPGPAPASAARSAAPGSGTASTGRRPARRSATRSGSSPRRPTRVTIARATCGPRIASIAGHALSAITANTS